MSKPPNYRPVGVEPRFPGKRGRSPDSLSIQYIASALISVYLLFLSAVACADANNGEFLGFKLGERYSVPRGSVGRDHITGALSYVVNPVHRHQHMGSMSLYVSPKSSIIGSIFGEWYFSNKASASEFSDRYLQTLEDQYRDWRRRRISLTNGDYQLWVDLEERPPIIDHWPSAKKFRVSVALIYAPDSVRRKDWLAMLAREATAFSARDIRNHQSSAAELRRR